MSEGSVRHQRLRAAFDAALAAGPSVPEPDLDRICNGDLDLRSRVARLLAAHQRAALFLEEPASPPSSAALPSWQSDTVPEHAADDFTGTARFEILARLGIGGMGIVYKARDRVRNEVVALKTLRRVSAGNLYRLKREFRSLADVAHVNLVCLYELFVEHDRPFFTMELVHGTSFVEFIRAERPLRRDRVIDAFRQLVRGVSALHRAGKLHCDIKPSNVMVTPDGRVVILDFGLIAELAPRAFGDEDVRGGTPAYMAPEEIAGRPPSEAGDWYSVGATLYEALTGVPPFTGSSIEVVRMKHASTPPAPSTLAPETPGDLDVVCVELLRRGPDRWSGAEAIQRLTGESEEPVVAPTVGTPAFVGRHHELEQLERVFERTKSCQESSVIVSGPSGIGKSALIRHFIDRLSAREPAIVLSGRCYEHESVPFKALDGVVDALSQYLGVLTRAEIDALLPSDIASLARLFPVLLRVRAIADAKQSAPGESSEPARLRRRAVEALRELLSRLSARHPVVMCIDDLQWSDADSIAVLESLMKSPGPHRLLILVCYRSSTGELASLHSRLIAATQLTELRLEPLGTDDATALVLGITGHQPAVVSAEALTVAREADGNPFLLEQLARFVATAPRGRPLGTFAEVFAGQLRSLPAGAQTFLETLALCGRPMLPEVVGDAAGVTSDVRSLVHLLNASHFIRRSNTTTVLIEPYHDRIRETLRAGVPADRRRRGHARLADALVARRVDDPEALFEHYRGAGDRERASMSAGAAGERAHAALAFDQASSFFRQALALAGTATPRLDWQMALAAALASAGRPQEAADAYLGAARQAGVAQRIELERNAAEQLLIGGHIDRGVEIMKHVLDAVGMKLPGSPRAALVSLALRRARWMIRGLAFTMRRAEDVPPEALRRIDTCWSVLTGLGMVDMIGAAAFSARHLRLALDAGEPYRVARAFAIEAAFVGVQGGSQRLQTERLLEQTRALSALVARPHAEALAALSEGMTALAVGRWKDASTFCERALAILTDRCTGVTWELNSAHNFFLGALLYQGELREVSNRLPPLLEDARQRVNLYLTTELCTRMNLVWLTADDPDEGERLAAESINGWSQRGFYRQHYSALLARTQTDLYRGCARDAWNRITSSWRALQATMLMKTQVIRVEATYLRARCALALAAENGDARLIALADRAAARIAAERMSWSDPIGMIVAAGVANLSGDAAGSAALMERAIGGFDAAEMRLYAAATRLRLSGVTGATAGADHATLADSWMASQGVRNPGAMTRMLLPGF